MIGRKFDCGCGQTPKVKRFGADCCNTPIQAPPSPCCEPHQFVYKMGFCLFTTCAVTANAEKFFLTFNDPFAAYVPLSANQVFFWHATAGLIQIHSYNGTSFEVSLVDAQKEGAGIEPTDCILVVVIPDNTVGANTLQRCLTGSFLAPARDASTTMFIVNGTAIPIGATVTITWQGNVGSYVVTAYLSATGNVYAYTVENTGSGLTPGTMVQGGEPNAGCVVPVEIITTVDLCNVSQTTQLDTIAGCLNGSPRALKPTAVDQIPVSDSNKVWGLRTLSDTNCCLTTAGCLKFTLSEGCGVSDTTTVADVGIDCMTAAWDAAIAAGTLVPAVIEGFPFLITNWNPDTKAITLSPVGDAAFDDEEILQLDAGTQICLGPCCNTCLSGSVSTSENVVDVENPELNANFAFAAPVNLPYDDEAAKFYLVGILTDGTDGVLELDTAYHETGDPLPKHADPLLIRQKICNDSLKGCNQDIEFYYNFDISINGLPVNFRMHVEVGHFVAESATLADGTTPNPNRYASSQNKWTDYIEGPIYNDVNVGEDVTQITPGTGLGFGGPEQPKNYPHVAGELRDQSLCINCDCINAVLWLFVMIEPLAGASGTGNVTIQPSWRRIVKKTDTNRIANMANDPTLEGWAGGSE